MSGDKKTTVNKCKVKSEDRVCFCKSCDVVTLAILKEEVAKSVTRSKSKVENFKNRPKL
jgi:hypothetical protein